MIKRFAKAVLQRTPYRIQRARDLNRFSAIEESLASLAARGYAPRLIVDGGANVGDFTRAASAIFPAARIAMIEPQPACQQALTALAADPRYTLHPVALGQASGSLKLAIDPGAVSTGAHIAPEYEGQSPDNVVTIAVETLDSVLGEHLTAADRTLLKLDLQGWEMEAFLGAEASLPAIEVILTEVSFYKQAYEPDIEDLIAHLHARGFALYDVAAITCRPRDNRAKQGDFIFVRRDSALMADTAWD
ncbi:MAG: FkbM family methyltransferase [Novosphingobium sp.]|nr:FkbM family methyltransferase [Novosphingobium sp.]